jgi:hypothetical protein
MDFDGKKRQEGSGGRKMDGGSVKRAGWRERQRDGKEDDDGSVAT